MNLKSRVLPLIGVVAVGAFLFLPGYLEVKRARQAAGLFFTEAQARSIEAKVIIRTKELENPFTWIDGKPYLVAARKEVNGNFVVIYGNIADDGITQNKALVSADCAKNRIRIVTQSVYERHLKENGYDLFGNRLPAWNDANSDDLASVLIVKEWRPPDQSAFYGIACKWESYASSPPNAAP